MDELWLRNTHILFEIQFPYFLLPKINTKWEMFADVHQKWQKGKSDSHRFPVCTRENFQHFLWNFVNEPWKSDERMCTPHNFF